MAVTIIEAPKGRPVQQIPEGVDAATFLALHHEVEDQFPTSPPAINVPRPEAKQVQQLPEGVKAENYLALRGEQP